jgi:hypothetical protein
LTVRAFIAFVEKVARTCAPLRSIRTGGDARVVTGFRFPRIFGADFAGIVRETGPGLQFNPEANYNIFNSLTV